MFQRASVSFNTSCVREPGIQSYHGEKASDRNATGRLLHYLLRDGALTPEQYLNGYVCDLGIIFLHLQSCILDGSILLHFIERHGKISITQMPNHCEISF